MLAGELDRAAFLVSIDTEMAWGLNHKPGAEYRYDLEQAHLQQLLELFDRHEIPATWAIVGHLMLDSCEAVDGIKHPEIVRPTYDWFPGDWFAADPCSRSSDAPTWYAPELIELIGSATTTQEIASHGFSHMIAGDPGCSRPAFDSEIRAALAAAADHDLSLRSFIHPRNQIGHNDVLAEHGILAFRGKRPPPAARPTIWDRLVDLTVGSARTTVRPIREEGTLWNFPATILFDVDTRPRTWKLWVRQVERRLAQAVAKRSLFHVWFHPHNLRDHPDAFLAALDRLCATAAAHRDRGTLETTTMGELASRLTSEADAEPSS